jgi:ABC-type dipeptide/oligopeptide/nickel transport system ATPase component
VRGPRRELAGIPGSPPDLRDPQPGCPFIPRCTHAIPACSDVDMTLEPWGGPVLGDPASVSHLTACPIVTPQVSQEGVLS